MHRADLSCEPGGRSAAIARPDALPPECRRVLDLALAGEPNKVIAARLGVGVRTVERRRAEALHRLGVGTLVEAARALAAESIPAPPATPDDPFGGSFRDAACGLIVVGLDGRFLAANPAFCRLLGRGENELLRTDVDAVTYPDDRDRDAARNAAFFSGTFTTFQASKRYVRPEGAAVAVHLVGSLVLGPNGRPRHGLGTVVA